MTRGAGDSAPAVARLIPWCGQKPMTQLRVLAGDKCSVIDVCPYSSINPAPVKTTTHAFLKRKEQASCSSGTAARDGGN